MWWLNAQHLHPVEVAIPTSLLFSAWGHTVAGVAGWTLLTATATSAATAAAKSRQSCPTLCDPTDSSPPGSHPWDSPGKNTGVGCHFLLQCMKVKSESEVAQSCLTLYDPMDCSLPASSVHGISQARVLEWVAIAFSPNKFIPSQGKGPNGIFQLYNTCSLNTIWWSRSLKRLRLIARGLKEFWSESFINLVVKEDKWSQYLVILSKTKKSHWASIQTGCTIGRLVSSDEVSAKLFRHQLLLIFFWKENSTSFLPFPLFLFQWSLLLSLVNDHPS